jgi:hypothetical protein
MIERSRPPLSWRLRLRLPLLALLIVLAPGAASSARDDAGGDAGDPGRLPLLEGGRHASVLPHGYFEEPAPGSSGPLDAALAESVGRGNVTVSYELDWNELEPEKEVYDLDGFREQLLEWEARGLTRVYLNVSAISIGTLGAPEDLVDPNDPDRFRDGMSIDDPVVVGRYNKMLDAVLPVFLEHGGFAFCAGNEVNDYFGEHPEEADNFANFLGAVRDHVRTIDTRLPVGVILTASAALEPEPWHQKILDRSDFAGYNYHALVPDVLSVIRDPATIRAQIRTLVREARGLPVLIQELGVPTGLDGVSEAEQADIARVMYEELYDHTRVRWVSWFKMTDFSQLFADVWGAQLLAAGNPAWWIERFKAWLRGIGLHVYETGRAKRAWPAYLDALDRVALDVEGLRWSSAEAFSWMPVERAESYDVARGLISELRGALGYAGALPLACEHPEASLADASEPPAGDAYYMLVRARDDGAVGSWGRALRDGGVAACE